MELGRYGSDPANLGVSRTQRSRGQHSLWVQLVLTSVGLIALTAILVGLPSAWLIDSELGRRAWAQLDQGGRASRALYASRWSALTSLSSLTAQRPSLYALLAEGDSTALETYLNTLRSGASMDLLALCDAENRLMTQVGQPLFSETCPADLDSRPLVLTDDATPSLWLVASQPLAMDPTIRVLVGRELSGEFVAQMRTQTGLEQTLFVGDLALVTSYAGGIAQWRQAPRYFIPTSSETEAQRRIEFSVAGTPYLATRFFLGEPDVQVEVSLPVADIQEAKRRMIGTLATTIIGVSVAGSVLGAWLARRTGGLLGRVAAQASIMSQGKLDDPITVETRVREVALLAIALEGARSRLQAAWSDLERERDWINHLLESIVEGIVTLDSHGRITFFSRGAERITGWERDAVLNRSCDEVFRLGESEEKFSQHIPVPGRRHKLTVVLANGELAILAVTGARLLPPESGEARVALVFRDVSEEEAVHRLLGQFLANVAHEFRTPLSSLAASIELLLDQAPDLSPWEWEELLNSVHLGVVGLQTLVDNLLESASIEAGHFRVFPTETKVQTIVNDATATMLPLLEKRRQRLLLDVPAELPPVKADPRRTVQVLVNLLSNANKYSPDESEIVVRVTAADLWVTVAVLDRGPGVPEDSRRWLFRRFTHAPSEHNHSQYGAGLGLSVVKAVIEALGGEVGVEDRPRGGSSFWIKLPVAGET